MPLPVVIPFAGLIWSAVTWIFREAVVKFVILGAVWLVVTELAPVGLGFISSFLNVSALNSSFSMLPPGVW